MIEKNVSTEYPPEHWGFMECADEVVLDLGCGRWEAVEHRDQSWPTTPEYLIQCGAKHVYAFDIDPAEIEWYTNNVSPKMNVTAIHRQIADVAGLTEILDMYNPTAIKCDIEGAEEVFLNLSDEAFRKIKFYAVETHSNSLYSAFVNRFNSLGYTITAKINLVHAPPMTVLFAKRKDDVQ